METRLQSGSSLYRPFFILFFQMTPATGDRVRNRLLLDSTDTSDITRFFNPRVVRFEKSPPINGIIANLSRAHQVHQGNAHTLRIVQVSASSAASEIRNGRDLRDQTHFGNNDNPNRWIQYTFEKWRVRPTLYARPSHFNGGTGDANPKSGSIAGSNDGITRTEIDRREENSELNARGAMASFPIAERGSEWKMLRMPRKSLRFGFSCSAWATASAGDHESEPPQFLQ
jgi:hypothetical protein